MRAPSRQRRFNGAMRARTGVIVGFGLGYYYGARAGRERYEQLDRVLAAVRRSRPYLEVRLAILETIEASRHRAVDLVRDAATSATSGRTDDITAVMPLPFDDTVEIEQPVDPSWN